jgi:lipoprotein NlpD
LLNASFLERWLVLVILRFLVILVSTINLFSCSTNTPAPIVDHSSTSKNVNNPTSSTSKITPSGATVSPIPAPKPIVQKKISKEPAKPEVKTESTSPTVAIDNAFKLTKPTKSSIINPFNEVSNKGVDFGGTLGDEVLAAADGKVIYAGSNLRTYGNLVIVNHNNGFVTVYANNKSLLVKEGETVKRGQKIAEMGNSESEKVKLHFELRKNSKPVDPTAFFKEN